MADRPGSEVPAYAGFGRQRVGGAQDVAARRGRAGFSIEGRRRVRAVLMRAMDAAADIRRPRGREVVFGPRDTYRVFQRALRPGLGEVAGGGRDAWHLVTGDGNC